MFPHVNPQVALLAKCKWAHHALEGSLPCMGPDMRNKMGAVGTSVRAEWTPVVVLPPFVSTRQWIVLSSGWMTDGTFISIVCRKAGQRITSVLTQVLPSCCISRKSEEKPKVQSWSKKYRSTKLNLIAKQVAKILAGLEIASLWTMLYSKVCFGGEIAPGKLY